MVNRVQVKMARVALGWGVRDLAREAVLRCRALRRWRDQFLAERARVLQLGFDERFIRIWEFYLAYCEAAFDQANIDVVQYTLQKS